MDKLYSLVSRIEARRQITECMMYAIVQRITELSYVKLAMLSFNVNLRTYLLYHLLTHIMHIII